MADPLKLMAVVAHPDDESLGVGGTLAKYANEGVETYLLTATRGEVAGLARRTSIPDLRRLVKCGKPNSSMRPPYWASKR